MLDISQIPSIYVEIMESAHNRMNHNASSDGCKCSVYVHRDCFGLLNPVKYKLSQIKSNLKFKNIFICAIFRNFGCMTRKDCESFLFPMIYQCCDTTLQCLSLLIVIYQI